MKPLLSEVNDSAALQNLGRASVQIVHDLKNHLNGLKLYATFLRRRMEKSERPADELETINKLISGIDRAAKDLTSLVQYGRPIALKKRSQVDLKDLLSRVLAPMSESGSESRRSGPGIDINLDPDPILGEFDPELLAEALKSISVRALQLHSPSDTCAQLQISLKVDVTEAGSTAVIEWGRLDSQGQDPFNSFMGGDAVRMSLAARFIEEHEGSATHHDGLLSVRLPLR